MVVVVFGHAHPGVHKFFYLRGCLTLLLSDLLCFLLVFLQVYLLQLVHQVFMVFVPNSFLLAIQFFPALDLFLCFLLLSHDGFSEIAGLGFEF